jgi:hypothetical protein
MFDGWGGHPRAERHVSLDLRRRERDELSRNPSTRGEDARSLAFTDVTPAFYAPTVASDDEYSVIRIFPDFADSVMWFIIGPVSYDESCISETLRHDMEAWESHYYKAMGNDLVWRSRDDERYHAAEGRRLAGGLSVEVGRAFEVEYFDEGDRKVRMRSDEPATNERAARAFDGIRAAHLELVARITREAEAGATFGWYAEGPNDEPRR